MLSFVKKGSGRLSSRRYSIGKGEAEAGLKMLEWLPDNGNCDSVGLPQQTGVCS